MIRNIWPYLNWVHWDIIYNLGLHGSSQINTCGGATAFSFVIIAKKANWLIGCGRSSEVNKRGDFFSFIITTNVPGLTGVVRQPPAFKFKELWGVGGGSIISKQRYFSDYNQRFVNLNLPVEVSKLFREFRWTISKKIKQTLGLNFALAPVVTFVLDWDYRENNGSRA